MFDALYYKFAEWWPYADKKALTMAIVVIAAIIAYIFIRLDQEKRKSGVSGESPELQQYKIQQVRDYFSEIQRTKQLPIKHTNLLLKEGEFAYFIENNVKFHESRSVRTTIHAGGGKGLGLGIFIGGGMSSSSSMPVLQHLDTGSLVITNRRLIFDGAQSTKNYKLADILTVEHYTDAIEVGLDNLKKSQVFSGMYNPFFWRALIVYVSQIPSSGELPSLEIR